MEHITADYFCNHIEEIIELANAENRCYVLVDEHSKEEVILVPVTVYEELCTTARHTTFQEQMEQYYGQPMSEIIQTVRGGHRKTHGMISDSPKVYKNVESKEPNVKAEISDYMNKAGEA